jgi:indole-3-glycerol phosphate synthase
MRDEMPDILRRICAAKQEVIAELKNTRTRELERRVREQSRPRGFRKALVSRSGVALIAEIKKASPSAGVIRDDFCVSSLAEAYETGGARCLSVLTDEEFFQGAGEYLTRARRTVRLPVLRKDFILDPLQVLESRALGADCVLLIVAALGAEQLETLMAECADLGMDALVEVHTGEELDVALGAGAGLVGINNRDLRSFEVRLETTCSLADRVPDSVTLVSESGIGGPEDVLRVKEAGVDAILVGESLMRSEDLAAATARLSDL